MRLFLKRTNKPKPTSFLRKLKTERLVLRAFEPGDAPEVFAYAKSPVVGPMAGWVPHRTLAESQPLYGNSWKVATYGRSWRKKWGV